MKKIGIIIILLGFGLTVFTTFSFFTKEEVVKVGPIEITKDKPHTFNWSPFVGIGIMAIGGFILLKGKKV